MGKIYMQVTRVGQGYICNSILVVTFVSLSTRNLFFTVTLFPNSMEGLITGAHNLKLKNNTRWQVITDKKKEKCDIFVLLREKILSRNIQRLRCGLPLSHLSVSTELECNVNTRLRRYRLDSDQSR